MQLIFRIFVKIGEDQNFEKWKSSAVNFWIIKPLDSQAVNDARDARKIREKKSHNTVNTMKTGSTRFPSRAEIIEWKIDT